MGQIDSFIFYHLDLCPKCKNLSLEIYDIWNNPMGLRSIIDLFEHGKSMPEGLLNKRAFYTIRCKKCGSCFPIRWYNNFPLPDCNPLNMKMFLAKFKEGKG